MAILRHALLGCGTLLREDLQNKPIIWHASHCEFHQAKPYQGFNCTCMLHYWAKLMRLWAFLRGGMTGNDLGWR